MTLEAADTGDSDGEGAADNDDDEEDEEGEAEDMEQFQESGLLDEVDPVSLYNYFRFPACTMLTMLSINLLTLSISYYY